MSFNIGDRVTPIDVDELKIFGEGTIVSKYYGGHPPQFDNIVGYYINFDISSGPTYTFVIDAIEYSNLYMIYTDRLELVEQEGSRPPLPKDLRLRGIALKIRELDKKFKQRQEAKKKIPFTEAAQRAYDAYTTADGTFTTTIAQVEGQPVRYSTFFSLEAATNSY